MGEPVCWDEPRDSCTRLEYVMPAALKKDAPRYARLYTCLNNHNNMDTYPDGSVYWPICAWSNNADGRSKDDPGYATVYMCLRTNTDALTCIAG